MSDINKTKKQLIDELASAGRQIKELEKSGFKHKQAYEALRKSEEKYRLLTDSSQDGIYIIGTEGFEYVNPAFEKILGYKAKEIFHKDFIFLDTVHPADKKLITERKEARKKGKKLPSIYSFRIITKFGKTKHVEVNTTRLPGEGIHILGFLRDITDQKQVEENIKQQSHTLGERIKELICLYGVSSLIEKTDVTSAEILQGTLKLIPPAWQYPDITCARIIFRGKKFKTKNFKTTKWKQAAALDLYNKKAGSIEVYYLKEKPKLYEGPFLKEERDLLDTIGKNISIALEKNQAEEKVKASLKEKEVLLQEIHHRVKNNMQLIVSLLRLQSYAAKDERVKDIFKVAEDRISSIALIHEKLYRSKDLANINFAHYIRSLANQLMRTYQIGPKQVILKTDIKGIRLDINQGIPVGLLLNELISNALKHAFPEGRKGEILLKFYADKKGKKTLIIKDNGIGFPDKADISKPETIGMQLIEDLTYQLGGKLELGKKAGTTIKITFS